MVYRLLRVLVNSRIGRAVNNWWTLKEYEREANEKAKVERMIERFSEMGLDMNYFQTDCEGNPRLVLQIAKESLPEFWKNITSQMLTRVRRAGK